jgi:O-antigen ligase
MIALPLGILYGLVAAWWTAAGAPMFGRAAKLLAGASFAASLVWVGYLMSASGEKSVLSMRERALALLDFSQADSVESYLESQDSARLHLMEVAWDKIRNDPLRGSGFHSTYLVGAVEAPIHNAYLQSWADLGLLGLLSYTWLTLGWTLRVGAVARTISRIDDPESRAMYATAVWGLCLFVLIGLRGPLLVEPSDWFFFLIPSALYWQLQREISVDQNRPHHQQSWDGWRGNDSLEGPVEPRWASV